MVQTALIIAFAFMSVIIGGGFSSGLEITQFFTSFGTIGIVGTVIATILFAFLGMEIGRISGELRATSHKEVLRHLFGHRLAVVFDAGLTFFLFGVGVAMLAGAGSMGKQLFGIDAFYGSLCMTVLVILTLCLRSERIVQVISAVTPLLVVTILLISIYSLTDIEILPSSTLNTTAATMEHAAPNWLLSAVLYVAFNIAVAFPMLAVIGGLTPSIRTTTVGGLLGGIGLGLLLGIMNVCLYFNVEQIHGLELPTLGLAGRHGTFFTVLMSISILCMIFSTAVGMFFSCTARWTTQETKQFRILAVILCVVGFGASFAGFTTLIGTVYPLLGYLGIGLILAVLISWWRLRKARRLAVSGAAK